MPVALSNEVLLRARIAQLQLEKTKQQQQQQQQQQRKSKPKNNSSSSSSAVASASVSPEAAGGTRDSGGGSGRPARKAPAAPSKHQLASAEAVRGRPGDDGTNAADGGGAQAGGSRGGGQPETEEETMRQFEAQVRGGDAV